MAITPSCSCGWVGKPAASQGVADYAKRRHRCERFAMEQARVARVRARQEDPGVRVDCEHPRARHQHGTRAAYVGDLCRCRPCREANQAYAAHLARQAAYGRRAYVDAGPAREHVRTLMAAGMGWKRVAEAAGVPISTLSWLLYGRGDRVPSEQLRPATADALLAVTLDLAPGAVVSGVGARRRVQALVARGWVQSDLATALGITAANFGQLIHGTAGVTVARDRAVQALYEQRWAATAPGLLAGAPSGRRGGALRAQRLAARLGWPPPMAWDDEDLDDPNAEPCITPLVGPTTSRRPIIDFDDVRFLLDQDLPAWEVAERFARTLDALEIACRRAGHDDLSARLRAEQPRRPRRAA